METEYGFESPGAMAVPVGEMEVYSIATSLFCASMIITTTLAPLKLLSLVFTTLPSNVLVEVFFVTTSPLAARSTTSLVGGDVNHGSACILVVFTREAWFGL